MRLRYLVPLIVAALCAFVGEASAATTLLPNGEQCFQTAAGPVSSGSVNMYYPNTTNVKTTWTNSAQTAANSAPIPLDSNGCAIIYGVGSYRQQLYTGPVVGGVTTGLLVFDLVTTDTSAYNAVFWSGLAGGTPNAILVIDTGFNATDGSVINFTALSTNTGSTTINPSGYGAILVEKDTTAGPVTLSGGEIIQSNTISVIYRATDNAFHILNPPIQSPAASAAPLCGATGYEALNDSGSPNTKIDITAASVVMISGTGQAINRSNVSVSVNFSINGANGLDIGSFTASTAYYVYLIDNGATTSALGSLSSTNPTLPNGYTYICRVQALYTANTTQLYSFNTVGASTFILNSGSSTDYVYHTVTGNCSTPTFTALTFNGLPPTAVQAIGHVSVTGVTAAAVARNSGGQSIASGSTTGISGGTIYHYFQVNIPIAAPQTVYACDSTTGNFISVDGWVDAVNVH